MTQSLAKYHARAPRYILDTDDNELIRLAGPHQTPWEEGTEIQNVSLTGLAFTAAADLCPVLGEIIKIQFTVPGSKQMACYGIVTRLDHHDSERIMVAVHFYKLEMGHRMSLAHGLAKKIRTAQLDRKVPMDHDPDAVFVFLPKIFMMGLSLYIWLILSYGYIAWGATGWFEGLAEWLSLP